MRPNFASRGEDQVRIGRSVNIARGRRARWKSCMSRETHRFSLHAFPVLLLVSLLVAAWPMTVLAQSPGNLRLPPPDFPTPEDDTLDDSEELPDLELPEVQTSSVRSVIVDTDPGVDDAAALVWLLSQRRYPVDVKGIVTVAGNTSVANATNNVGLLLDWLEETSIPVIQGAAQPTSVPLSFAGQLIHGPDGLGGITLGVSSAQTGDNAQALTDATAFYCAEDTLSPGTIVMALGPLTNLAAAITQCPASWENVEIISLGGARFAGNQTPVTEYNYWQDPAAASTVLMNATVDGESLYHVDIVPVEAFDQLKIRQRDLRIMERRGNTAIQNLVPALEGYIQVLSEGGTSAPLPDVVAAIYALDRQFGHSESALVKVVAGPEIPELVRGQTVVGTTFNERITMIVDDEELNDLIQQYLFDPDQLFLELGAIAAQHPDNAEFVSDIRAVLMYVSFIFDLTTSSPDWGGPSRGRENEKGEDIELEGAGQIEHELYIPLVGAE